MKWTHQRRPGRTARRITSIPAVLADALDPWRLMAAVPWAYDGAHLICIYRAKNADNVARLARQARALRITMECWALDEVAPALVAETTGEGPGSRFALLNRLAADVAPDKWLILCDDDVRFGAGGLRTLLGLSRRFGLQLAQPAHARTGSFYSHAITRRHRGVSARETTFVEIGPVVAIAPSLRPFILPFPEHGMGWGAELTWYDLHRQGATLGIVDASPVKHLSPVGATYDSDAERVAQERLFAARGLTGWREVQTNVRCFRLHQA